jgi:hypothetical protein
MIRVKVRLGSLDAVGKIFHFEAGLEYSLLIQKVAVKFGLSTLPAAAADDDDNENNNNNKERRRLYLGGDVLVEDTHEIDDGDELVFMAGANETQKLRSSSILKKKDKDNDDDDSSYIEDVTDKVLKERHSRLDKEAIDCDDDDDDDDKESATTQKLRSSSILKKKDKDNDDDESSYIEDVTDKVLKERHSRLDKEAIDCDDDDDDDDKESVTEESEDDDSSFNDNDDDEEEQEDDSDNDDSSCEEIPKSRKRKRNGALRPLESSSPLEVLMDEKDVPAAPGKPHETDQDETMDQFSTLAARGGDSTATPADQVVKDRIIKLLNTGFHETSNEHEAKNAMKLAQRLMRKHNLSQALLLQERDAKSNKDKNGGEEPLKGGMVQLKIVNRRTGGPAQFARWISNLTGPICKNFSVECFHCVRRGHSCSITFYGIYTNSQLAAYAFRVATERIAQMSAQHVPLPSSHISTKSARLSYSLGIVNGISNEVNATMEQEEEKRIRKLEKARRAVSSGEAYQESDDDEEDGPGGGNDDGDDDGDDDDGVGYSFPDDPADKDSTNDEEDHNDKPAAPKTTAHKDSPKAPHSSSSLSGVALGRRLKEIEQEESAALVLIDHREKVAERVLEENHIKVRKGRKRAPITFDRNSYDMGVRDAKELDINQRAIRDGIKSKKEESEKR